MSQAPPPPPPPSTPPPPAGPPPSSGPPSGAYPIRMALDRGYEVDRWRPIVNWILAIPQIVVAGVLIWIERVLGFICFFTILFTKKVPPEIFNFRVMAYRYLWRTLTFTFFMRNEYPPFSLQ